MGNFGVFQVQYRIWLVHGVWVCFMVVVCHNGGVFSLWLCGLFIKQGMLRFLAGSCSTSDSALGGNFKGGKNDLFVDKGICLYEVKPHEVQLGALHVVRPN